MAKPTHTHYPQNDELFPNSPGDNMKWDEMSEAIREQQDKNKVLAELINSMLTRIEQLERTIEEWRVYRLHEIEKGLAEARQEVGLE